MAETSWRAEAALFLASASYARPNSPTLQVLLRRRAELLFSRLREAPARAEGGVANATAEAAVDEWTKTYPALGELEQR